MLQPCANTKYSPHMPISSCADITQLCQYIYLILTHYNQKMPQALAYVHLTFLAYVLKKYACHTTKGCPTALIMLFTCGPHIIAHSSQKTTHCNFYSTML